MCGPVWVTRLALCPVYSSARWQVAVVVRAFRGVGVYERLWCSPRAQNDPQLCGVGGTAVTATFIPSQDWHRLHSLDGGGSGGVYIPRLHISLSGAVLGNLKMQYRCHQLEEDTEPD